MDGLAVRANVDNGATLDRSDRREAQASDGSDDDQRADMQVVFAEIRRRRFLFGAEE